MSFFLLKFTWIFFFLCFGLLSLKIKSVFRFGARKFEDAIVSWTHGLDFFLIQAIYLTIKSIFHGAKRILF